MGNLRKEKIISPPFVRCSLNRVTRNLFERRGWACISVLALWRHRPAAILLLRSSGYVRKRKSWKDDIFVQARSIFQVDLKIKEWILYLKETVPDWRLLRDKTSIYFNHSVGLATVYASELSNCELFSFGMKLVSF